MAIYKVDKGYRADVYLYTDDNGKKIRRSKTFRLKGGATDWERKILEQYKTGELDMQGDMKLSEYLDYWYDTYVMVNTKYQTQKRYDVLIRCIKDHMGHLKLNKVKVPHIDRFYADLQKEMVTLKNGTTKRRYSNGTILKVHRVFRQAMEKAVGWDMIVKNPVNYSTPPKEEKTDINIWTLTQVNTFLDKIKDEPIFLPSFIAFHTGMRIGEVCALQWDDIFLEEGYLMVNNNAVEMTGQGVVMDTPKTPSSNAKVTLTNDLMTMLKKVKREQQLHKLAHGISKDFTFICSWEDGRPLRPTYVSEYFRIFVERNDMPKLTPHGLRHTHASILFELGESSHAISKRLRHSRVSTTDDIYIHITEETKNSTAELFNKAVEDAK